MAGALHSQIHKMVVVGSGFIWSQSWPSLDWAVPVLSASPHIIALTSMSIFLVQGPRTGHSTSNAASTVLSKAEGSPPQISWPSCNTLPNAAKNTISLPSSRGTLLAPVQCGVHKDSQMLYCRVDSELCGTQDAKGPEVHSCGVGRCICLPCTEMILGAINRNCKAKHRSKQRENVRSDILSPRDSIWGKE